MKFEFNTNVDFNGMYSLGEHGGLIVEVKDGKVSLEHFPVCTSDCLRVADEDLFGESCGTITTTTDHCTYDWDSEDTDGFEIDLEVTEDEDKLYVLAEKIREYDKSGHLVSILTKLINEKNKASNKIVKNISEIMTNLSLTLREAKEKMQKSCTNE